MTAHCQPMPGSLVEEMLQLVARAICDRPGENAAQCEGRTNHMVHSTLGFAPRDGLELMLASIVIGHFNLILDSMRDVFQGQADQLKAKTKTTIVALNRAMLEMIKELREERRRPAAHSVEVAQPHAAVAAPSPHPELSDAVVPTPVPRTPDRPQPEAGSPQAASSMAPASVSEVAPPKPGDTGQDSVTPASNQAASEASQLAAQVTLRPDLPTLTDDGEADRTGLIAANEALLAAMNETIAEAWRTHRAEATAATGD